MWHFIDNSLFQMCTNFSSYLASSGEGSDGTHLFERLIYLQRNWQEDEKFGERHETEFQELVRGSIYLRCIITFSLYHVFSNCSN